MVCGRIVFKEEEVETRRMMQMNSEEKGKKGKRKTEGWVSGKMERQWKWRSGSGGNGKHGVPCLGWCLPRVSGWGRQSQPGLIYWYQTGFLVTSFTGPLVAVPSILCSLPEPHLWARTWGNTHALCLVSFSISQGRKAVKGAASLCSNVVWQFSLAPGNSRPWGAGPVVSLFTSQWGCSQLNCCERIQEDRLW